MDKRWKMENKDKIIFQNERIALKFRTLYLKNRKINEK